MKRLLTSAAALVLVITSSGCMTNGIAKVTRELANDTNSISLKVNGWGVSIELQRNGGGFSAIATEVGSNGVTLTPVTTLRVQPAK